WFILLGGALALLAGMLVVVLAEALVPTGSLPGVLFIIRGSRARAHRLRRYVEITRILARHGMLPYLRGARRAELASGEGRRALARSVARALEEGGVTFVKLGQVLATRHDLLPPEFVAELGRLQDDAATIEWSEVEAVVAAGLRDPPDAVFATIDHAPLAAASIAQVHLAMLHDGEAVVVKVRRPGIDTVVEGDLDIVQRLAERLERRTRWGRGVGAVGLARGFAEALREELDLRVEARNMASVAAAHAARAGEPVVHIPSARADLCTANVLVMERLQGRPLSSIAAADVIGDRPALALALFDEVLAEVMLDGVFHADPHPGNVFVLADGRVGLLDFGSVG
ncbi:MAG: ABC1 kinase family protein, partial [Acidimicrobiales bacterium]